MTQKEKLAYSQLTDRLYIVNTRGKQDDVTQNFLQVFLLWMHETYPTLTPGKKFTRSLRKKGTDIVQWEITLENKNFVTSPE